MGFGHHHIQNITLADCLGATTYKPEELKEIRKINVVEWSNESRALLPQVYDYKNPKVSDAYVTASKKIIEKQIQKAGIRLVALLQVLFKNS